MKKRTLLLVAILFILLLVGIADILVGLFADNINNKSYVWREPVQRYYYGYNVEVTGLSGNEVNGTTVVMVPIPASKEGKFFTPYTQKESNSIKGPYFKNMTETFDNQQAIGNWTTFIAETEKGHMLGFRTNETKLEDIDYSTWFVADYLDIFDPINNESSILFPIENLSNTSSVPYGNYTLYASNPTYDTYVYLSNNLKGEEKVSFFVYLKANNDPTEWPEKYRGEYANLLLANVSDTGYVKVRVILGQEVPWDINSTGVFGSQYAYDYYDNKTSHVVNETSNHS